MAKVIIADENEGRRNLLANTLEREGFDVTRGSTIRQTEATALATMPEVVVMDAEWKTGDPIDASQRMMSDPEFAFKCRIVLLSRQTSSDYMVAAAKAGVSEVLAKPLNMKQLIDQLHKHARKEFVPPPADVGAVGSREGTFDVSVGMGDPNWALPMLSNMLGADVINQDFVADIVARLEDEEVGSDLDLDPAVLSEILKVALGKLVEDGVSTEKEEDEGVSYESLKASEKLGGEAKPKKKRSSKKVGMTMDEMLQAQADDIAEEIEETMDVVLEELPEFITLLPEEELMSIDPEVVRFTHLSIRYVLDLMFDIARPEALNDLTLMTRVEDGAQMLADIMLHLPQAPDEEE